MDPSVADPGILLFVERFNYQIAEHIRLSNILQPLSPFMSTANSQWRCPIRRHYDMCMDKFRRLSVRKQIDWQARRIGDAQNLGDKAVVSHIKCWDPELVGHSVEDSMSRAFTLEVVRRTIC